MKKYLLIIMMLCVGVAYAQAKMAFAVYNTSDESFQFFYDDSKPEADEQLVVYDLNEGDDMPAWYGKINPETVAFTPSFADAQPTSTHGWFAGFNQITEIQNLPALNTSEVTDMGSMFAYCNSLSNLYLQDFNTSNVTNMSSMFEQCSSIEELDLSSFNTSKVTNMSFMFYGCTLLTDFSVNGFDTSKVEKFSGMFYGCTSLTKLNLMGWNTAKATNMTAMFSQNENLKTILVGKNWNTDNVTESVDMFSYSPKITGGAGTENLENASIPKDKTYAHVDEGEKNPGLLSYEAYAMYNDGTLFFYYDDEKANYPSDAVYEITNSGAPGWYGRDLPITKVEFSPSFANTRPTSNYAWFNGLSDLTEIIGIEYLNTSRSTNMSDMFEGCSSLTSLDLSHFDTRNVEYMNYMFSNCRSLESLDVSNFDASLVNNTDYGLTCMFASCESLTELNLSNFNTKGVKNMNGMFSGCNSLTSLDLSSFNTSLTTNMGSMFSGCSSLTELDLSSFRTGSVTNMRSMFQGCYNLPSLKTNFNTSQVTDMSSMFSGCSSLKTLDLTGFNTGNVTDMKEMFSGCSSLGTIAVGVSDDTNTFWDTSSVTTSDDMFWYCPALKGEQGTIYNSENIDATYARIDGGTAAPGYLSSVNRDYGISLNGTAVIFSNMNDVLNDGGSVTFDGAGTLTLNNAQLTGLSVKSTATTNSDGEVHIVVNGDCKVAGTSPQVVALHKKTIIEGTGKLIVNQTGTNPGAGIRLMSEEADLTVKDIELGIAAGLHGILGYNKGLSKPNYVNTITFDNANCHINIIGNVLDSANPGCIMDAKAIDLFDCTMTTGSVKIQSKTSGYCVPEKKMVIERDESPIVTAIEGMEAVQTFDASAPLYNLQGQRVSQPVKGLIYIQRGKKVLF